MPGSGDDYPRTLREVGIMLKTLRREVNDLRTAMRDEIDDLNARLDGIRNLILTGVACPVIVGVVLTMIFK